MPGGRSQISRLETVGFYSRDVLGEWRCQGQRTRQGLGVGEGQSVTQETQVPSLGWEDPPEEGMATHSSILGWRIPMDRGAWQATVHRITKSLT